MRSCLDSYHKILNYARTTQTQSGLRVAAYLDRSETILPRHRTRFLDPIISDSIIISESIIDRLHWNGMAEPSTGEILDFALSLCLDAGRFILPLWKNVAVDHKADGSEVTDADRGAEQLLRKRIGERYPDHAILGEEFGGPKRKDAEHLWLLDPVDGTASFAIGLPMFGTLIGYLRRGEPCVGVIAAHALGEIVYAASGQGCWHQRDNSTPKRVRTTAVTEVADAFVVSTTLEDTDMDPRNPKASVCLSRLYRQSRRFRWSGDCINYALLCQGYIDVALDTRVNPWDVAAVTPCVREAGGVLTSLDGNHDVVWQPDVVASANAKLHAKILQSLRQV